MFAFTELVQASENRKPSILLDSRAKYPLSSYLEILEDKTAALTIRDVSSPGFSEHFVSAKTAVPSFGITESVIWARFRIKNSGEKTRQMLLSYDYPITNFVTLFLPENDRFISVDAGHSIARPDLAIHHRYSIFSLSIPAREEATYYLRVESEGIMVLPVTLWRPTALARQDHSDQIIFGIYFGFLFAFIVYFSVVSIRLKNPASIWFSVFILFLGLLMACYQGYIQEQLGSENYRWNGPLLIAVIGFLCFTGAKFLRTFLLVHVYSKWKDNVLRLLQWLGFIFIPMNFFPNPFTPILSIYLIGVGPIFSTTISIVFWKRGVPNAKYFAMGWLIGHLTSELDLRRAFGWVPWTPAMTYLLPAAIFSSIIFFSLAVVEQSREYRYFAHRDGLTGLANRRYFDEMMKVEWNRSLRNLRSVTLVMIDVDCFKTFNDTYGHEAGDACLVAVANVLKRAVRRAGELAARYGGEEFIVMLCETKAEEASTYAEKIRNAVEELAIPHASSDVKGVVTVSLGVSAVVPNREIKPVDFIRQTDNALYRAKNRGRNRVEFI